MAGERDCACRAHYKRIQANTSLQALSETFSALPSPSILGGNPAKAEADGFSYWAAEPRHVFEFTSAQKDPFPKLQDVLDRYTLADDSAINHRERASLPDGMFRGGWIGYFSYELGRYIERLPERAVDDLHMPLIRLCFYDRVMAYDHHSDVFWLMALELPGDSESPAQKIAMLEHYLGQAQRGRLAEPPPADIESMKFGDITGNMTRDDYLDAVRRIKSYIRDGDVYQVNLSQRFEPPFTGKPIGLFHWQNQYNSSGYAAYIDAGDFQIVSASPEMFITVHDGRIRTKPIKGTRPRINASGPHATTLNAERFHDLLTSEKEQAELNMIVDLERNDVARICKPGTRHVIQPRTIETYPTVYHAVATVGGELRDGITFNDILKAMFPGGSITGAPKIRAMEIIDELEPTARGVYTGSLGFIGLDGTVCLNIGIRTIIITRGSAFVPVGGGIVADSDPQAEWDETITKARALLVGIRAVQNERSVCPSG
jgi:para-aminobenzoate synthetase component 1